MEFGNKMSNNSILPTKYLTQYLGILACLLLIGCGSTTTPKPEADSLTSKPALAPTLQFIPKPKVDKKGQPVPYKAEENPYLEVKFSIRKEYIETFIEARRAFKQKNYAEAKTRLEQLTVKSKRLSGPWVMLGDIARLNQQNPEAESHYQQAIKINKRNVNAYLRLAMVQREQGKFITSQNTYATALDLWPDFPEAHLNLGVLYDLYLNDDTKAQKHMEAYQFLTNGKNEEVANWIYEIQKRTGMANELETHKTTLINKPLS